MVADSSLHVSHKALSDTAVCLDGVQTISEEIRDDRRGDTFSAVGLDDRCRGG